MPKVTRKAPAQEAPEPARSAKSEGAKKATKRQEADSDAPIVRFDYMSAYSKVDANFVHSEKHRSKAAKRAAKGKEAFNPYGTVTFAPGLKKKPIRANLAPESGNRSTSFRPSKKI
ncbi:hypothetical protein IWQ60_007916 [Tieghemiomyces parasiticus]|uniref:Uncharacterized protein n=1 Tax=Tieghemiomyces parasiticus TaxID=78921 RepID=A0A9W8A2Q9_9FUNG|nr:hypothetical protein IWQ60_007916 [Tieghemiomyces parasiticus]